jgi:hypothetical protein
MKAKAIQRIVNCVKAEKRALHGEFKSYWKVTSEQLARKNNIDINDIRNNLEMYDGSEVKNRSVH